MIIKLRSGSAWPGLRIQGGIVGIECGKLCGGGLHVPYSIISLQLCERVRETLGPIIPTVGPHEALSTSERGHVPRIVVASGDRNIQS